MSILYLLWVLLLLGSCFFVSLIIAKKGTLLKTCTVTLCMFAFEYFTISVVFLWADLFAVWIILLVMSMINLSILLIKRKTAMEETVRLKERVDNREFFVILLIFLLLPFTWTKSEDVRTSSDMGMYFEKAVVLMSEDTGVVRRLDEFQTVSANADKGVIAIQEQLQGIYVRGVEGDQIIYDYHSIPTWVTALALFGKMFGLKYCTAVLSVLYIMAILCAFYCFQNISRTKYGEYLSFAIFALSPIIIYVSKATLTEMAFVAVFLSGCMFLSENDIVEKYISIIPFGLLPFIHISMYMYMPIFIVCLIYLYINRKEKVYAVINIAWITLYMISIFYCHRISYRYTKEQYLRFRFLGNDLKKIVFLLLIIFIIAILIQAILMNIKDQKKDFLSRLADKVLPIGIVLCVIVIIVGSIVNGYYLAFTDVYQPLEGTWQLRSNYAGQGWVAIRHLNLVNIMMCTGVVSIPITFVYSITRKEKKDVIENCLYLVCLYTILIYTFIQIDTPKNYYASRYFAMIIVPALSLLMARIAVNKKWTILLLIWIVCFDGFFAVFFTGRSSFQGQYDLMEDVMQKIPEDAVVLVREEDESLNQILVNNLRELNGNLVYNYLNYDDVREVFDGQPIYVISGVEQDNEDQKLLLYKDYEIMGNLGGEDGKYMTKQIYTYYESVYVYEMAN